MTLTGQLIHPGTVAADLNGFSAVTLRGVTNRMPLWRCWWFVPVHESRHLQEGFALAGEGPPGVVR
jgi:hypothetical protein